MKKLSWLVALVAFAWGAPAFAQGPRAEVSVLLGWAFSEGVDGDPVATADGKKKNLVELEQYSAGTVRLNEITIEKK